MIINRIVAVQMITRHLYFLCCFFLAAHCFAQVSKPDTAFLTSAKLHQEKLYDEFIYGQSRLYNGSEHRDYLSKNDEHPYFGVDDWVYGYILYDDELYENVPMFYDLSRDKVISEHILNGAKLELVAEKIARFSLSGHTFVRLRKNETQMISEGFYDLLYDGATKVYVRREKLLQEKVESNNIIARFEERNRIFIFKDGIYFPVKKKGSVLDVFSDRKEDLKSFLNKNKIKFKSDRETATVRLAEFYDVQSK
jgi:hypothetical protein